MGHLQLLCFGLPDTPPCDTGPDVNGDGDINVLDLNWRQEADPRHRDKRHGN